MYGKACIEMAFNLGGVYMIPVRVSFWYELSISYRVYMDDTNIDTGMTHEPKQ